MRGRERRKGGGRGATDGRLLSVNVIIQKTTGPNWSFGVHEGKVEKKVTE